MRFVHIADLHIGKRLCETSLIPDQEFVLDFIARETEARRPDAVLISGDVYDRSVPGVDAVTLLDRFLMRLMATGAKVFMIGGNHDSQERLAFGREMLAREGLTISAPYSGRLEKYALGDADIWLMPHIRPREAEIFFEGARFESVGDAVRAILAREEPDPARKNILLAHQFVTARGQTAERCDSEVDPIGGENGVDAALFDRFDYVALGHLHAPQQAGRPQVRYAGSPVKYSFSETRHKKSMAWVTVDENGVEVELIPLPALHGMRQLRGNLADLLSAAEPSEDYIRVTLTDEVPPVSPMERLGAFYTNILRLELEPRGQTEPELTGTARREPMELFAEFYEMMSGAILTDEMLEMAKDAYDCVRSEGGA